MCSGKYYTELNGMPTDVSLFVWLPEERAKWVQMRAKHEYCCAILGLISELPRDATLTSSPPSPTGH
jgi:hypothetical protein